MSPRFEPITGRYLNLTLLGDRTGSTSRKPAKAFRCCACIPPAPTAGSIAGCSTTSASPTTNRVIVFDMRGTASRRRRRAIRTRNTS